MLFYIVTPTFNALEWLERCVRSVADQSGEGIEVHHHVQDGGSTDGTPEWLSRWQEEHRDAPGYTFSYASGRDAGMYDAINRSWAIMPEETDITAHLNSDEQYLPGALRGVAEAMAQHPEADISLGTYIIVDKDSRYICHRRPITPHHWSSQTVCEIITCSCFHRATVFRRHGIRFDARYRALADLVFYRDIIATRPRFLILPELITGTFTVTGDNLSWSETSRREWCALVDTLPWYVGHRHGFTYLWCNLLRRLTDVRCPSPHSYALYMPYDSQRTEKPICRPTCHWGCRTVGESPESMDFISRL